MERIGMNRRGGTEFGLFPVAMAAMDFIYRLNICWMLLTRRIRELLGHLFVKATNSSGMIL